MNHPQVEAKQLWPHVLHALGLADTTVTSHTLVTHFNTYLSHFAAAEAARTGLRSAEAQRSIERARMGVAALEQLKARARASKLRVARSKLDAAQSEIGTAAAPSDSAASVKAEPNSNSAGSKRKRASTAASPEVPPSTDASAATSGDAKKKLKLDASPSASSVSENKSDDASAADSKPRASARKRKQSNKAKEESDSISASSALSAVPASSGGSEAADTATAKPAVDPAKCYVCEKKDQRTNLMHCRQCKRGIAPPPTPESRKFV